MENNGSTHQILELKERYVERKLTALNVFINKKSKISKTRNILLEEEAGKNLQEKNTCRRKQIGQDLFSEILKQRFFFLL